MLRVTGTASLLAYFIKEIYAGQNYHFATHHLCDNFTTTNVDHKSNYGSQGLFNITYTPHCIHSSKKIENLIDKI